LEFCSLFFFAQVDEEKGGTDDKSQGPRDAEFAFQDIREKTKLFEELTLACGLARGFRQTVFQV